MDENSGRLIANGQIVTELRRSLQSGKHGLSAVPGWIKQVIKGDMWRQRVEPGTGEIVGFPTFAAFVAAPPLEGLGADVGLIKRICTDDKEALDLIDQVVTLPDHRPTSNDNVITNEPAEQGNSEAYALRKLRRDRPDLHGRVLSGDVSAHGAMVEAGFRRPMMTVPRDLAGLARALRRRLTSDEVAALIALLETV